MQVIVNDLVVSYERSGQGPVMLLLHGWGLDSNSFEPLIPYLEQNFTLVRVDLPGFGGSQLSDRSWGPKDYSIHIRDALQKMSIMQNDITYILAHGTSGVIATYIIKEEVLTPKKLILVGCGVLGELSTSGIGKISKIVKKILPGSVVLDNEEKNTLTNENAKLLHKNYILLTKKDVRAYTERIHLPTLLLYGSNDTIVPVEVGQILQHSLDNSTLQVVENGDHDMCTNLAEQVAQYVKEFLQ